MFEYLRMAYFAFCQNLCQNSQRYVLLKNIFLVSISHCQTSYYNTLASIFHSSHSIPFEC